ncbi:MAG TPA: metallophosphoesterase [Opitutaceae bacterium]|nr:metallophosphoesterase [Opitutaceae bacterium]
MASPLTRIFSDIHYGDRSSRVRSITQLSPLFRGVGTVVLNGDTLDTRHGPYPERTAALREEATGFFASAGPKVVLMTGNHDPDLSDLHAQTLGAGKVFVTHGDVLFETIVPWGRDVPLIRRLVEEERARYAGPDADSLEGRLKIFRRACARIPQRHQVETNRWKHLLSYSADTLWPKSLWRVFWAWWVAPERAAALARMHRPAARFVLMGHTHRPGVWTTRDGRIVVNTGSFTRPLGAFAVDLTDVQLTVRRVEKRDGEFHPGRTLAEFALAESPA